MPPYGTEPESNGRHRDLIVAGVFLVVAFSTLFWSQPTQQLISTTMQVTVLRPFTLVQGQLEAARLRAIEVETMVARIDSLSSMLQSHSALVDENRTLRSLLDLSERAGSEYVPATVLRPGTPGVHDWLARTRVVVAR